MRRIVPAFLFATLSTACSSAAFEVTPPAEDAISAEETAPTDSGATPTHDTDVAVDSGSPDTGDAGSETATDAGSETAIDAGSETATDTGSETATDTGSDVATDTGSATPDACVPNGCGSCAVLPHALGSACGVCGAGKYICNGTSDVTCLDPVNTPPPGAACGICNTSKYVCSADGKTTACAKPVDKNACGGCATLAGVPGGSCGTCGTYACAIDQESVTCVEATGPAVGTTCGMCSKSKYVCTETRTTACGLDDDRKTVAAFDAAPTTIASAVTAPGWSLGQLASTTKTGRVTSVSVRIAREVASLGADVGTVTVRFLETDGATYVHELAQQVMPADSPLLSATPNWVKFTFDTPVKELPAGSRFAISVETNSTVYRLRWEYGAPAIAGQKVYEGNLSDLNNVVVKEGLHPLKVEMLTCDY